MTRKLPTFLSENENGLWMTEDERENLKIDYRIKEIVFEEKSPIQHVMILDSYSFGRMLVLDGIVQTTSIDGHIYNETISHVPLSIHPNPKKVLIIGGGDCGVAKEVCRYSSVQQIDVVEIDQVVVEACRKYLPEVSGGLSDPRVRFIFEDGVNYAQNSPAIYDVIIVDSSDPIGPAEVLIEKNFYRSLFNALKEDGLMVCQSQSPIFHGEAMEQIFARIDDIFPKTKMFTAVVPTYPGGLWSFTLGSKKYTAPNSASIKELDTLYINEQLLESCFALPEFMIKQISR
ncbi:MAG TPA: polyamine aminopropyltransferase [Desulfitobacterium dehalogenans]|uniref:Polyamine aminopropyltransferase n=1 Tax=Desulfitobacterium dehalogenans TaxID=36854 RepID=A0A7C7D8Q8_9FIRM|nr:polyamine aminopropyltransferase [Desulfitobacterium dehalogenans]